MREVEHIVVMGHGQCGGVVAFIDGLDEQRHDHEFIHQWMLMMDPLGTEVLRRAGSETGEDLQRLCEFAAVRQALENLKTCLIIRERLAGGTFEYSWRSFWCFEWRTHGARCRLR